MDKLTRTTFLQLKVGDTVYFSWLKDNDPTNDRSTMLTILEIDDDCYTCNDGYFLYRNCWYDETTYDTSRGYAELFLMN